MKKRAVVAVAVFLLCVGVFISFRVFAQNQGAVVTFSAQDWGYVFFDHSNARIYVYNARNGELSTIWKVNRLGEPLEQIKQRVDRLSAPSGTMR